ncbi:MAG: HAMP domain-containing protein [Gammaproteobacteria bacterium]|nr:HAMP domain-containing protein [Gammaproteobacteria bacterium]
MSAPEPSEQREDVPDIKVKKLFRKTTFGVFMLFGAIGLSTSILNVYTVDTHLSEEYISNSKGIAKTIADASVDILLNRDLAALQSLIDQFLEIQGIRYIYITDESGEFIAHTFVPGIPEEILQGDPLSTETVERTLAGMGDFVEVGSPILAGVAGTVHVGMDRGLIALKIQRAIGQQMWLFVVVGAIGVVAAIWLVNLAAKPMARLMAYAVSLARDDETTDAELLDRNDEVGHLARLFRHFASRRKPGSDGS